MPAALWSVEDGVFDGAALSTLYLFDSIREISDYSFANCENLQTLHINAAHAPVYSGTYYVAFADKFDRLLSMREEQKIVLFSGSSARFGYDSAAIDAPFFNLMEANYDMAALLDLRQYGQVFTAFSAYLDSRAGMDARSYTLSPSDFDEEGNPVETPSYNEYGDYILYRPNNMLSCLVTGTKHSSKSSSPPR